MYANLGFAQALRLECLNVVGLGDAIVVADEVGPRGRRSPVVIETRGHRLELDLVSAVIANQHHVDKAALLETAGCALEYALEGIVRDRNRPCKTHVAGGRSNAAFGHVS